MVVLHPDVFILDNFSFESLLTNTLLLLEINYASDRLGVSLYHTGQALGAWQGAAPQGGMLMLQVAV